MTQMQVPEAKFRGGYQGLVVYLWHAMARGSHRIGMCSNPPLLRLMYRVLLSTAIMRPKSRTVILSAPFFHVFIDY